MPLTNLQTEQPSLPCRFTDLTQAYFTVTLPNAYNLNLIDLAYSNASSNAMVRRRAATSLSGLTSAPAVDITLPFWPTAGLDIAGFTRFPHLIYSSAGFGNYKYWRFDILDTGNAAGYVQIGRLILASKSANTCYEFPRGVSADGTIGTNEPSARLVSGGGQIYPTIRSKTGRQKFTVVGVKEVDVLKTIGGIQRTRGVSRSVLFVKSTTNPTYIVEKSTYGLLTIADKPYRSYGEGTGIAYNIDGTIEEMS